MHASTADGRQPNVDCYGFALVADAIASVQYALVASKPSQQALESWFGAGCINAVPHAARTINQLRRNVAALEVNNLCLDVFALGLAMARNVTICISGFKGQPLPIPASRADARPTNTSTK